MAFQPDPGLLSLLGLVAWGDIGELTTYVSKRGKIVWMFKTYPHKPTSPLQKERRDAWSAAAAAWNALTPAQRQQWDLATRRASLPLHGFNLWMHWSITHDDQCIRTLEHQTNTTLLAA